VEKTSPSLSELFEPIRDDLARVDVEFVRHVQSKVELIPTIGRYIQSSGGKRIRPAVLLMAARLCGYTGDRAVLYASVVEFIHTATLVHDDNLSDRGVQLTPGLALSTRGVGLLAVALDMPVTVTTWRGGGVWIAPRLAVSYEAALYDQLALGVVGSLAWRGGTGGAPMRSGQVLPELLVTATWKLF